jgi:hypothetical protein
MQPEHRHAHRGALRKRGEPLGTAQDPLMAGLLRVSGEISPENVKHAEWAFATMEQPPRSAQGAIKAVRLGISKDACR